MMNRVDAIIAAFIGEITALYFYFFFKDARNAATGDFLLPEELRGLLWILMFAFPLLAPLALWMASLIGKKAVSIFQLAKFLLVGVMASIFDLGTLALFMALTGLKEGLWYIVFKAISFIVSAILKYFPDKLWAFKKNDSADKRKEFLQFFSVTLVSFVVNVGVAGVIVNVLGPQFDLDEQTWGSIAAMGGIIVAFTINFIGYKFFVFKK